MFLEPGMVDVVRERFPAPEGLTYVWPGEPGYDEATQKMIDGPAAVVLAWEDRAASTVRACGTAVGILRHGYLTREPMFSRTRSAR
jgi:hypothetical protein